eukprot:27385_4
MKVRGGKSLSASFGNMEIHDKSIPLSRLFFVTIFMRRAPSVELRTAPTATEGSVLVDMGAYSVPPCFRKSSEIFRSVNPRQKITSTAASGSSARKRTCFRMPLKKCSRRWRQADAVFSRSGSRSGIVTAGNEGELNRRETASDFSMLVSFDGIFQKSSIVFPSLSLSRKPFGYSFLAFSHRTLKSAEIVLSSLYLLHSAHIGCPYLPQSCLTSASGHATAGAFCRPYQPLISISSRITGLDSLALLHPLCDFRDGLSATPPIHQPVAWFLTSRASPP